MKVYVGTDLEGVAGVVTFYRDTTPGGDGYAMARRLLTGEINAAVEGMLAFGVEDILVCDGHGPGAVDFEGLHPAVKLLHGRPLAPRAVRDEVVREYDVCMMIGQHAMAGIAAANMNHTQNSKSIESYTLNGEPIGEIAQFALYHGSLGLPLIFLSGDEEACREAEALAPGIVTAAVKQSLSRNSAISLAAPAARDKIRQGVQRALRAQAQAPLEPFSRPGPYVLEKRFFHTDAADGAAAAAPDAERVDARTVRFRSEDIRDIIYR